jgi:hypothetical protein
MPCSSRAMQYLRRHNVEVSLHGRRCSVGRVARVLHARYADTHASAAGEIAATGGFSGELRSAVFEGTKHCISFSILSSE